MWTGGFAASPSTCNQIYLIAAITVPYHFKPNGESQLPLQSLPGPLLLARVRQNRGPRPVDGSAPRWASTPPTVQGPADCELLFLPSKAKTQQMPRRGTTIQRGLQNGRWAGTASVSSRPPLPIYLVVRPRGRPQHRTSAADKVEWPTSLRISPKGGSRGSTGGLDAISVGR